MNRTLRDAGREMGFTMSSNDLTGRLLSTLAAGKPGGRFLELGTGVGVGSAWLLAGMDERSTLTSVERQPEQVEHAKQFLGHDPRVRFHLSDGLEFLSAHHLEHGEPFDLIFADTWPGKITHPEAALELVAPGGFYIVDDMELGWHREEAGLEPYLQEVWRGQRALTRLLEGRSDFSCARLEWSSGLLLCTKRPSSEPQSLVKRPS